MFKRTRDNDPCGEDATGSCGECVTPPPKGITQCVQLCNGVQCLRRASNGKDMCAQHWSLSEKVKAREE